MSRLTEQTSDVPGGTSLAVPTSVRTLVAGGTPTAVLTGDMAAGLPAGGLAARTMGARHSLTRVTWRLLDSRILAAAAEVLDADVAGPLITWLSRIQRVVDAARTTVADPRTPDLVEVLLPSRPFTHSEGLTVTVAVERVVEATLRFRLDVIADLGETAVVVRRGTIPEVVCDVLTVRASLSLAAWPSPLWEPDPVSLPKVHLGVRPPVPVPLVPVPRPPVPQRAARPGG